MSRNNRQFQPLYLALCVVCKGLYVTRRFHSRTCSTRCRMQLSRHGTTRVEFEPLALLSVYSKAMGLQPSTAEALCELGRMHRRAPLVYGEAVELMRRRPLRSGEYP